MLWEYSALCCACRNDYRASMFCPPPPPPVRKHTRERDMQRRRERGSENEEKGAMEAEGVLCCWQPRAICGQSAETGTLCLSRHLQLKQTGVMQEASRTNTRLLLTVERERDDGGGGEGHGQSRGGTTTTTTTNWIRMPEFKPASFLQTFVSLHSFHRYKFEEIKCFLSFIFYFFFSSP